MPEKQLEIKLSPEQFELLMRLALKAGYASLDEFARDRLIKALGAEGDGKSSAQAASALTLEPLIEAESEIKRIHQELRVFITEALSDLKRLDALAPESGEDDQWERLAELVFSKSPRLASLAQESLPNPAASEPLEELESKKEKKRSIPNLADESAEETPYYDDDPTRTSTSGGFSDMSGGPPPRKRSK